MENAQPEPSMEEILASIRRIISEDDEAEGAAQPEGAQTDAASSAGNVASPAAFRPGPATPPETASPAETPLKLEDVEMVTENTAQKAEEQIDSEEILAKSASEAASAAFTSLSQSVRVSEGPGKTLEDIVTEMLRPMVKEWLDANLPAIVEEKVEDEVQRVARRRSR